MKILRQVMCVFGRPDDAPDGIKTSGTKDWMKVNIRYQSPASIRYPIKEREGRNPRHWDGPFKKG